MAVSDVAEDTINLQDKALPSAVPGVDVLKLVGITLESESRY